MTTTYDIIKAAIINKQQIVATYKGHVRELCPHVLGTKNGKEQALFYQFGGTSSTKAIIPGSPNNWRCLLLDELTHVSARDGAWHTAHNHARPQSCVNIIDVEVQP